MNYPHNSKPEGSPVALLARSTSKEPTTILIVEDDDDLVSLLDHRLRHEQLPTRIARDGDEACRILEQDQTIALVLLDLMLPIKDGWEVCRYIRQHPEAKIASLPVVMLSALSSGDSRIRGMECGADMYIAKPYSVREVVLTSRKLLARRQEHLGLKTEIESLRHQEREEEENQRMLFHELRTHFTVIGGLCRRLHTHVDALPEQQAGRSKNYLEVIDKSVKQLSEMTEEMLLVSKLQHADLEIKPSRPCRLDELVAEVLTVCGAKANMKDIALAVGPIPAHPVYLHRLGAKIVLSSLLENAIKYSPPGSRVELNISLSPGEVAIEVGDQGPGIPVHEQQLIFEPYYRGEGTRESQAGSGLGLYSVKRLTEGMNGKVTLTSSPESGSLFRIVFRLEGGTELSSPRSGDQ